MVQKYSIYKGLQKPLVYKGFKGKFIAWGITSLIAGLVIGGLTVALANMFLGLLLLVLVTSGGLAFTFYSQKNGLHSKAKARGIVIQPNHLMIRYETKKDSI